ncbi:MAG: hypothetical protein ACFCD0_12310 [Gemmataceae bacterium]
MRCPFRYFLVGMTFGVWLMALSETSFSQQRTQSQRPVATKSSQPPRPQIVLSDQFNRKHSLQQHRGHVVVLVYGDRKGSDAARKIGTYLHVLFHPTAKGLSGAKAQDAPPVAIPNWPQNVPMPDVKVIPVACIGKVPQFVQGFVRRGFRKAVSDVPVWLDFGSTMKSNFGLVANVPNIAVVDTQGVYRLTGGGNLTREQFTQLINTIRQLRAEVRPATTGTMPVLMAPGG